MSFDNIPVELRAYPQWVLWRLEHKDGSPKPTKVPYIPRPNSGKASVTAPATWGTIGECLLAPINSFEPVPMGAPLVGFSGIGFVFTANDPFAGIDLDDTHGDAEAYARQQTVYNAFDSYSELSPSGSGVHIIVKGSIPMGRKRAGIELYSNERYLTFTGNVINPKPICERQELLTLLFEQMGGPHTELVFGDDQAQTIDDEQVIRQALQAGNGDKFAKLHAGEWQTMYASQSEADFAYIDILAFYSKNKEQLFRLYSVSVLGQVPKDNFPQRWRRTRWVMYMIDKSFDRQLPPVDTEGLKIAFQKLLRANDGAAAIEPGGTVTAAPENVARLSDASSVGPTSLPALQSHNAVPSNGFPPGLVGMVAQYILDQAPRAVPEIALAGAIGLVSGICGRGYNVSGTGLNQYILLLADTGVGKDAISDGTNKLLSAVVKSVPEAEKFKGPGELVSSAGLIKWLNRAPCVFSVLGEFGVLLEQMASPNAPANLKGLERVLLQLYSKSGAGSSLDPSAYSDIKSVTEVVNSPSLTIIGESVPDRFYATLDDRIIASGLLPRFMIFEYLGKREYIRDDMQTIEPSINLIMETATLASHALTLARNGTPQTIGFMPEATKLFRDYDIWTTDQINSTRNDNVKQLWNRAHLKAMKLAGVVAVGIRPLEPWITVHEANWAIDRITSQTQKMINKFETGSTGQVGGNEMRQTNALLHCIGSFQAEQWDKYKVYGGTWEMHRDGIVLHSHIQRRLVNMACFREDRIGSTQAIARTVKSLLEGDELREINKAQMSLNYGCTPKAYVVANPTRFVEAVELHKHRV